MRRRPLDLVLMTTGAAVLVTTALLAKRRVYGWEVSAFQAINGLPDSIRPYLWVLNQYGTAVTIPVATVVALLFRKWRLALSLAISGAAVYMLALVIKGYVDRGRPSDFLEGVVERETFSPDSLGYPSGHAAVALAITIIVLAYLGRPWQVAAIVLAITVPIARLYVAAHLPLDLIGGAALGVTVASAVNLLIGVPIHAPTANIRAGPTTGAAVPRATPAAPRPAPPAAFGPPPQSISRRGEGAVSGVPARPSTYPPSFPWTRVMSTDSPQ